MTNGSSSNSTSSNNNSGTGRRYQLYIGNLTWVSNVGLVLKITLNLKLFKIHIFLMSYMFAVDN